MDSEIKTIIAFVFKRSGKESLSFSDLYLTLSMDLNWFTPEEAKDFVKVALEEKILKKEGESVTPSFDINKIVVPIGFNPSKKSSNLKKIEIFEKDDVFNQLVQRIANKTNLSEDKILEKIKTTEEQKNVTKEVSALLICKEFFVTFDDLIEKI